MSTPVSSFASKENPKADLLSKILFSFAISEDLDTRAAVDEEILLSSLTEQREKEKHQLYLTIQDVVGPVLKKCALSSQKIGQAGQEPALVKELVLSCPGFDPKQLTQIVSEVLKGLFSICSEPIFNPAGKSVFWPLHDITVLCAGVTGSKNRNPISEESKKQGPNSKKRAEASCLPLQSNKVASVRQKKPSGVSGASTPSVFYDNRDFKVSVLEELKNNLEDLLRQPLPLNASGKSKFSVHELLQELSELHKHIFMRGPFDVNFSSEPYCPQAGLYGSSLRASLGISEKANDLDIYFKVPHLVDSDFIDSVSDVIKNFLKRRSNPNRISTVFHHSKISLSEFDMNVFYLGYGAGLNITYFTPSGSSSGKGFYLSNFACEIEDLFIPFDHQFVGLKPTIKTLSGAPVEGVLQRISSKIFAVPKVFTHNAFERLIGYALQGWLPCYGDFTSAIEDYFVKQGTLTDRLSNFNAGLCKRLHMRPGLIEPKKDNAYWLAHLNLLLLVQHSSSSPLMAELGSKLELIIGSNSPLLIPMKLLKELMLSIASLNQNKEAFALFEAALLPWSRTHALSQMASFPLVEYDQHLLASIPSPGQWSRSIENWLDYLVTSTEFEGSEIARKWKSFFQKLPVSQASFHALGEWGFELPMSWIQRASLTHNRELWQAITQTILPLLAPRSLGLLSLEFINSVENFEGSEIEDSIRHLFQPETREGQTAVEKSGALLPKHPELNDVSVHPLALLFESQRLNWISQKSLEWFLKQEEALAEPFLLWLISRREKLSPSELAVIFDVYQQKLSAETPLFQNLTSSCLLAHVKHLNKSELSDIDGPKDLQVEESLNSSSEASSFSYVTLVESFQVWFRAVGKEGFKPLEKMRGREVTQALMLMDSSRLYQHLRLELRDAFDKSVHETLCLIVKVKNLNQSPLLASLFLSLSKLYFARLSELLQDAIELEQNRVEGQESQALISACLTKLLHETNWSKVQLYDVELVLAEFERLIKQQSPSFLFRLVKETHNYRHKNLVASLLDAVAGRLLELPYGADECYELLDTFIFLKSLGVVSCEVETKLHSTIPLMLESVQIGLQGLSKLLSSEYTKHPVSPVWMGLKKSFGQKIFVPYVLEQMQKASEEEIQEASDLVMFAAQTPKGQSDLGNESLIYLTLKTPQVIHKADLGLFYRLAEFCYEQQIEIQNLEAFLLSCAEQDSAALERSLKFKQQTRIKIIEAHWKRGRIHQAPFAVRRFFAPELFTSVMQNKLKLTDLLVYTDEKELIDRWLKLCYLSSVSTPGVEIVSDAASKSSALEESYLDSSLFDCSIASLYYSMRSNQQDQDKIRAAFFQKLLDLIENNLCSYQLAQSIVEKVLSFESERFDASNSDFRMFLKGFLEHWNVSKIVSQPSHKVPSNTRTSPYDLAKMLICSWFTGEKGSLMSQDITLLFQGWVGSLGQASYMPSADQVSVVGQYLLDRQENMFESWVIHLLSKIELLEDKAWVDLYRKSISYGRKKEEFSLARRCLLAFVIGEKKLHGQERTSYAAQLMFKAGMCELSSLFKKDQENLSPKLKRHLSELSILSKVAANIRLNQLKNECFSQQVIEHELFISLFENAWQRLLDLVEGENFIHEISNESSLKKLVDTVESLSFAFTPIYMEEKLDDLQQNIDPFITRIVNRLKKVEQRLTQLKYWPRLKDATQTFLIKFGQENARFSLPHASLEEAKPSIHYEYELWHGIECGWIKINTEAMLSFLLIPDQYQNEPELAVHLYSAYITAFTLIKGIVTGLKGVFPSSIDTDQGYLQGLLACWGRLNYQQKQLVSNIFSFGLRKIPFVEAVQFEKTHENIAALTAEMKTNLSLISHFQDKLTLLQQKKSTGEAVNIEQIQQLEQSLVEMQAASKKNISDLKIEKNNLENRLLRLIEICVHFLDPSLMKKYKAIHSWSENKKDKTAGLDCHLLSFEFCQEQEQEDHQIAPKRLMHYIESLNKIGQRLSGVNPSECLDDGLKNPFVSRLSIWSCLYQASQELTAHKHRLEQVLLEDWKLSRDPSFELQVRQFFKVMHLYLYEGDQELSLNSVLSVYYIYFTRGGTSELEIAPMLLPKEQLNEAWVAEAMLLLMRSFELGEENAVSELFVRGLVAHATSYVEAVDAKISNKYPVSFYSVFIHNLLPLLKPSTRSPKCDLFASEEFGKLILFLEKISLESDRWATGLAETDRLFFLKDVRNVLMALHLAHLWIPERFSSQKKLIFDNLTRACSSMSKICHDTIFAKSAWWQNYGKEAFLEWNATCLLAVDLYKRGSLSIEDYRLFQLIDRADKVNWVNSCWLVDDPMSGQPSLVEVEDFLKPTEFELATFKLNAIQAEDDSSEEITGSKEVGECDFHTTSHAFVNSAAFLDTYYACENQLEMSSPKEGVIKEVNHSNDRPSIVRWSLGDILKRLFLAYDIETNFEALKLFKGALKKLYPCKDDPLKDTGLLPEDPKRELSALNWRFHDLFRLWHLEFAYEGLNYVNKVELLENPLKARNYAVFKKRISLFIDFSSCWTEIMKQESPFNQPFTSIFAESNDLLGKTIAAVSLLYVSPSEVPSERLNLLARKNLQEKLEIAKEDMAFMMSF